MNDALLVNCFTNKKNGWFDIDISTDLYVYPCCAYHGLHHEQHTFEDERLDKLPKNWNSIKHHSIEDILKKWSEFLNDEYWSDEKLCPKFCLRQCGIDSKNEKHIYNKE